MDIRFFWVDVDLTKPPAERPVVLLRKPMWPVCRVSEAPATREADWVLTRSSEMVRVPLYAHLLRRPPRDEGEEDGEGAEGNGGTDVDDVPMLIGAGLDIGLRLMAQHPDVGPVLGAVVVMGRPVQVVGGEHLRLLMNVLIGAER